MKETVANMCAKINAEKAKEPVLTKEAQSAKYFFDLRKSNVQLLNLY